MTNTTETNIDNAVAMINRALRAFESEMSDDQFRQWMTIPEDSRRKLAYVAYKQAKKMVGA